MRIWAHRNTAATALSDDIWTTSAEPSWVGAVSIPRIPVLAVDPMREEPAVARLPGQAGGRNTVNDRVPPLVHPASVQEGEASLFASVDAWS